MHGDKKIKILVWKERTKSCYKGSYGIKMSSVVFVRNILVQISVPSLQYDSAEENHYWMILNLTQLFAVCVKVLADTWGGGTSVPVMLKHRVQKYVEKLIDVNFLPFMVCNYDFK